MNDGGPRRNVSELLQEAHRQIKSLRAKLAEREQLDAVAIVGIGCRFPGEVDSPESFWRLLVNEVDAVGEIPHGRWDINAFYDADPSAAGKHYSRHGSFLDKIDEFDAEFFGIAPAEAEHLDPQQRLLLEVAWETLEHAGIPADRLRGSRTGSFVGAIYADYLTRQLREAGSESINAYYGTGNTLSGMAGRLSYFFGWNGPSISLDTACSTSLVAVHQACNAIRSNECDFALAGGVNLMLTPEPSINLSKARMISPTGRCRTFDAAADGYVRGEGCGLVLLRRLSVAKAEGNRILGVIRGSAVNHDGRSNGLTAPNRQAQVALLRTAMQSAGIRPDEVGYLECHGTGTSLGDPIEVGAITEALLSDRPTDRPLALGAVKTNYGHLEGAAGICGLIKASLVVQHGQVPANLHLETLNPYIRTAHLPVVFPTARTPWPQSYLSRIAGVSSFGLLGTNAHVLLEAVPPVPPDEKVVCESADASGQRLLTLSARTPMAIQHLAKRYESSLKASDHIELSDLCHTANTGRNHFQHRAAFVVSSIQQLSQKLSRFEAKTPRAGTPKIAFAFTGQGSQYGRMGRELYASEFVFREALDRCSSILGPLDSRMLLDILFEEDRVASSLHSTRYTQPALFAFEYALSELWASWGVRPFVCVGHSVGEYVAACRAGIFTLEDALRIVAARGALMQQLPLDGAMAAVRASALQVQDAIAELAETLSIAAINSPSETVVSGQRDHLDIVLSRLREAGFASHELQVSHAFHSPLMRPMLDAFSELLEGVRFGPAQLPVISNVSGRLIQADEMSTAAYWLHHILAPVRFAESVHSLADYGCDLILEIGPQPILSQLICKNAPAASWQILQSMKPPVGEREQMFATLGDIYVAGSDVDLDGFERHRVGSTISLPTYPFQRRRIWFQPATDSVAQATKSVKPFVSAFPANGTSSPDKSLRFSLMFFAATERPLDEDKYRLVLEAARYADQNGFQSIWVPERHFSDMGSLYPNPAVLHAALARETTRVRLMAGSVVAPLHSPFRIAEEWSMVDNLSGGRVGISFASGWNPDDFVFFPERYQDRRDHLYSVADTVRKLWRGESVESTNGAGRTFQAKILPTPIQKELPFWITAAGNPKSFEKAGELGANLLTHLLDQSVEELTHKIRLYRASRAAHGYDPEAGIVTVMVHTSVGPDAAAAREAAREPFCNYLKASRGLLTGLALSRGQDVDLDTISEADLDDLVGFLFDRFSNTRALIGSPESCAELTRALAAAGVDEIASLMDFGQSVDQVLAGLPWLQQLKLKRIELQQTKPQQPTPSVTDQACNRLLYEIAWRPLTWPVASPAKRPSNWLIFADKGNNIATWLVASLGAENCLVIHQPDSLEEVLRNAEPAFSRASQVVVLWPLDASTPDPADEHENVSERARRLVQSLTVIFRARTLAVFWVTRGALRLAKDRHLPALAQSPLWGFARVLRLEKAEWTSNLIDLDPAGSDQSNAELSLKALEAFGAENNLAIRSGRIWAERLTRLQELPQRRRAWEIRPDVAYLITGGLGGVGIEIAEWLVKQGAKSLLLLGRSAPHPVAKNKIASLQERGASVTVASVDISDKTALAATLDRWRQDGKAPVRGVVHAAGSWHDTTIDQMEPAMLADVLAPKIGGAWNLERLITEPLDFFISFSSLASLLPTYGQANYAAANAFLDAHAAWRRANGKPGLSINWGPWAEIGFGATEAGLRAQERLESFGMRRLAPSDALRAFETVIDSESHGVVVANVDWGLLARVDPALSRIPLLTELATQPIINSLRPSGNAEARQSYDAPFVAGGETSLSGIAEIVAGVFRQPLAELRADEPLPNLGLDSLMAMEIKNRILAQTDVNIPISQFLSGASVRSLATWVNTDLQLRQIAEPAAPEEAESATEEFAL